jgi:hypothetical protein
MVCAARSVMSEDSGRFRGLVRGCGRGARVRRCRSEASGPRSIRLAGQGVGSRKTLYMNCENVDLAPTGGLG